MNLTYQDFRKQRVPEIEEQDRKRAWVRDYYLNKSKPYVTWDWDFGVTPLPHENDCYISNVYFLPSFSAVWNKSYSWNARCFDALVFDHLFCVEVRFLRFWFKIWRSARHQ